MQCGILDLGTNTVHGAVYRIEDGHFFKKDSNSIASPVLAHTMNHVLTPTGIDALIQAVQTVIEWFSAQQTEKIFAIATASLRGLENKEEVRIKILQETGLSIEILSGSDEAECDFLAIRNVKKLSDGVGVDLGGGSMQVVQFSQNRLKLAKSLSVGTNRYWRKFVRGDRADQAELDALYRAAMVEISVLPPIHINRFYAMGGTAKRAAKVMELLTGEKTEILKITDLQQLLLMPGFLEATAKERTKTLTAGIVIFSALATHLKAEEIQVLSCGVREGYLCKLLKEKRI